MRTFLTLYARAVGALGLGLLAAALALDTRWTGQTWGIVAMVVTIMFLRAQQIPDRRIDGDRPFERSQHP